MKGLKNKIAIVTGGASGIGRAIALRLAEEGIRTIIFDIDEVGAARVADEARAGGGKISVRACDITDFAVVQESVAWVESEIGPVDFLVNNAGWDLPINFSKTETGGSCSPGCHIVKDYDRQTAVDYTVNKEEP